MTAKEPIGRGVRSSQESLVLFTLHRGRGAELQLRKCRFRGAEFLDLRFWVETDAGLVPTRKGVTIRPEQLPELIEQLQAACDEFGLIRDTGGGSRLVADDQFEPIGARMIPPSPHGSNRT